MSSSLFQTFHNHHERSVCDAVDEAVARYPGIAGQPDLLTDVACVALNRLPPRYIRHEVDFSFYLSDRERAESQTAVDEAVAFAFEFVQARQAMHARR